MRRCARWPRTSCRRRGRIWKRPPRTCASCSCPRTRRTRRAPSSKSAPAPAATRPPSSPATCSHVHRATPTKGWKVEIVVRERGHGRRLQGSRGRDQGRGVFARLKFESGGHRVQRVPETETQGRIHTSAATVAVLPEPDDVEIDINDADMKIDTMRARAPAASTSTRPNRRSASPTCPTGIVVIVQDERCQHKNRAARHGAPARHASTTPSAAPRTPRAPPTARSRSAPATAASASAPTTSRKTA